MNQTVGTLTALMDVWWITVVAAVVGAVVIGIWFRLRGGGKGGFRRVWAVLSSGEAEAALAFVRQQILEEHVEQGTRRAKDAVRLFGCDLDRSILPNGRTTSSTTSIGETDSEPPPQATSPGKRTR